MVNPDCRQSSSRALFLLRAFLSSFIDHFGRWLTCFGVTRVTFARFKDTGVTASITWWRWEALSGPLVPRMTDCRPRKGWRDPEGSPFCPRDGSSNPSRGLSTAPGRWWEIWRRVPSWSRMDTFLLLIILSFLPSSDENGIVEETIGVASMVSYLIQVDLGTKKVIMNYDAWVTFQGFACSMV